MRVVTNKGGEQVENVSENAGSDDQISTWESEEMGRGEKVIVALIGLVGSCFVSLVVRYFIPGFQGGIGLGMLCGIVFGSLMGIYLGSSELKKREATVTEGKLQ